MVRIMTGTLIEVGLGKRSPESMKEILAVSYTHLDVYKRQIPGGGKRTAVQQHGLERGWIAGAS